MIEEPCPLPPHVVSLLQAALDLNTTQSGQLARRLCMSKKTVRTYWDRIEAMLGAHSRFEAVRHAEKNGWITQPERREDKSPDGSA